MVAAHGDFDPLVGASLTLNAVNEPVLDGNAAGPPTRQVFLQCLRLTQALKGAPARVLNQGIDSGRDRWVGLKPVLIIVSSVSGEMNPHDLVEIGGSINSCSVVRPASASWMDSRSRLALEGLLSR
jgi:hypothetical protein